MMESIFVADMSRDELICLFNCDIENDDYYDVLAYNIALLDVDYLEKNLDLFDLKRKRAAIFGLGFTKNAEHRIVEKLKSFLVNGESMLVSEAMDSLARMEIFDCWEAVNQQLKSNSEFVRGAALRFARAALQQKAIPLLLSALNDPHYIVRENAIDELSELGDNSIIERIKPLIADKHKDVRQAAETAIELLNEND